MSMRNKLLLSIFGGVVVLGAAAFYFGPKIYQIYFGPKTPVVNNLFSTGLADFSKGDYQAARDSFEQGKLQATTATQRAYLEISIASTYETTDLAHCAELYLAVINNTQYPSAIRSYAATYLLLALSNNYNSTVAQSVFSAEPWNGYWDVSTKDERQRYQAAIARGHEWALALAPNFLSHLLAGEYYARAYTTFDAAQKKDAQQKIFEYYLSGSKEFATVASSGTAYPNIIAIGHRTRAVYAEELNQLFKQKIISATGPGPVSDTAVENAYSTAEAYMDKLTTSSFKNTMMRTTWLYHAHFLLSLSTRDAAHLTQLGDKLAGLIQADPVSAHKVNGYSDATNIQFADFRKTLVSLATNYSSALKEALLAKTTTFTTKDFVPK